MAKKYLHPSATRRTTLTARANLTAYSVGDKRKVTDADRYWLECTTAGTSAAAPPAFTPVYGNTVTDGTVVWTYRGTGDSYTPADRGFNIDDTFSSTSNYNAVADADEVVMTTGTYTPATNLITPVTGTVIRVLPITDAGVYTIAKDSVTINFGSLGSGDGLTINLIGWKFHGITFTAAPQDNVSQTAAGDAASFTNCKFTNAVRHGFYQTAPGTGVTLMDTCESNANGQMGFAGVFIGLNSGTSASALICLDCKASLNGTQGFYIVAISKRCIGTVQAGATRYAFRWSAPGQQYASNCTARVIGALNDGYAYVGFEQPGALLQSIATGFANPGAGTGSGATIPSGAYRGLIGGMDFYGNDTNWATSTYATDIDNGSPCTVDPAFASATDDTVTGTLTGQLWTKIAGEGTAWITTGAVGVVSSGTGSAVYPPHTRRHGV